MATLKLGSTTAISESSGTVSIPSSVSFPAGHIIQINSTQGFASQVFDADVDVILEVALSNVKASSHVYISWQVPVQLSTGATNAEGLEIYLYRDGSSQSVGSVVSGTNIIPANASPNEAVGWAFKGSVNIELYWTESGSCIDENALTGTNIYKLCGSSYGASPQICAHEGLISMTAMEVAR
jgi:hypothetical protein